MSHQSSPAEIADVAFKPYVKEAADKLLDLIDMQVGVQLQRAADQDAEILRLETLLADKTVEAADLAHKLRLASVKLAGETLRADQGWERYEAANLMCQNQQVTIASVKREPQWLDIESAPKGRKLIAGYFNKLGNWRTIIARYYLPGTLAAHEDADESQCDEEGYAKEGWYEESETHEFIMPTDEPPTYYMFLTPPPIKNYLTTDSGERRDADQA